MLTISISYIIFVLELCIVSLSPIAQKRKNNILYVIFFIQAFVIFGFRDISVLADTDGYAFHFNAIKNNIPFWHTSTDERFGTGYLIFEQFVHNVISDNFLVYNLIVTSFILSTTLYFFYRYSRLAWLSLFIFVISRFMFGEMIAVRQGIALCISLYGMQYLFSNKYYIFALVVLLASTFHSSAFILLLYIPLSLFHKNSLMGNVLLYGGCILIFLFFDTLLSRYSQSVDGSRYLNAAEEKAYFNLVGIFNSIQSIGMFSYIAFLRFQIGKTSNGLTILQDKYNYFLYKIAVLLVLTSILSIKLFVLQRFSIYFYPLVIIYASNLYKNKCQKKNVATIFLVTFLSLTFFYIMYNRPEWVKIIPYSFYDRFILFYNYPGL